MKRYCCEYKVPKHRVYLTSHNKNLQNIGWSLKILQLSLRCHNFSSLVETQTNVINCFCIQAVQNFQSSEPIIGSKRYIVSKRKSLKCRRNMLIEMQHILQHILLTRAIEKQLRSLMTEQPIYRFLGLWEHAQVRSCWENWMQPWNVIFSLHHSWPIMGVAWSSLTH